MMAAPGRRIREAALDGGGLLRALTAHNGVFSMRVVR